MRVSEGTRRDHPRVGLHANAVPLRTGAVSRFRADRRGRGPGSRVPLTWTSTTVERQLSSRVVAGSLGARPCGGHCAVQGRRGHGRPWSSAGATPRPRKSAWNFGACTARALGRDGEQRPPPARGILGMCGGTGRGREPRFPAEATGAAPCDPRSHLAGRTGRAAAPWTARTLGEESRAAPRGGRWRCGCGSPAGGRACAGWAGHPLTLHGESSAPPLTARQAGAQGGRNRPRAPSHLQGVPGVRRGARRPMWRWWPRDTASLCLCRGGPAGTACPGRRVHGAGTREWNRPAARRGHTQREPRTGWGAPGNCTAELPVPHFRHAP